MHFPSQLMIITNVEVTVKRSLGVFRVYTVKSVICWFCMVCTTKMLNTGDHKCWNIEQNTNFWGNLADQAVPVEVASV